jgi:hypothetical protein
MENPMNLNKPLTALALATLSMLTLDASAATIRVTCEVSPARSKISVDGKNLAAGQYSTVVISGANMAAHPAQAAVGGEVETDYDSNPKDIAAGAIAIPPTFITGGQVTGKVLDAAGNTVKSDTVLCRVKRR